jgi:hypothetical protein
MEYQGLAALNLPQVEFERLFSLLYELHPQAELTTYKQRAAKYMPAKGSPEKWVFPPKLSGRVADETMPSFAADDGSMPSAWTLGHRMTDKEIDTEVGIFPTQYFPTFKDEERPAPQGERFGDFAVEELQGEVPYVPPPTSAFPGASEQPEERVRGQKQANALLSRPRLLAWYIAALEQRVEDARKRDVAEMARDLRQIDAWLGPRRHVEDALPAGSAPPTTGSDGGQTGSSEDSDSLRGIEEASRKSRLHDPKNEEKAKPSTTG